MANQCPNCGGFDTDMLAEENKACIGWVTGIIALPMLTGCCMFLGSTSSGQWDWGGLIMAIVFMFLILIIIRVFGTDPSLMKCNLCNYRWDSRKSYEIHTRPDLIALGKEKLEEEDEKRKKVAEALWWLETYGKDKD